MPHVLENCEDPKLALTAQMLRHRGTVNLKAWGTSMLPSVWPGDVLTIQSVSHEEIVPGDIVLVMRDSRFCVHRLIEGRPSCDCTLWITRGDALPHNDPPVASPQLLGRVTGIRRGKRSVVPRGRISPLWFAVAWMLWWGHFCSRAGTRRLFRVVFGALSMSSSISPSRASHP